MILFRFTATNYIPLKGVPNEPDKEDLLRRMKMHYPDIELDTEVLFVEHLSVAETRAQHGDKIPNSSEGTLCL